MAQTPLSQDAFARKVDTLLAGQDSAVVPASSLVDLAFDSLCFERHDTLLLKFTGGAAEQVLSLPYERFFVNESYVANSLEDACVASADRILVKKKYPGYQGPIEFQKAARRG